MCLEADWPAASLTTKRFGNVKLWCFLYRMFNTLRLRQNGCHFANNIFECIFLNQNVWISIKISLEFVPKGSSDNTLALVQIMAWRHYRNKWWFVYWHICASLGLNELKNQIQSHILAGEIRSVTSYLVISWCIKHLISSHTSDPWAWPLLTWFYWHYSMDK